MSSLLQSPRTILTSLPLTNSTAMPVNIVHGDYSQLVAYYVLNMWPSHLGLPILLATILLSKTVKRRHPTFVNMCITFIIVGISSCLLLYAGRATGPEPSRVLCLFQASLLYGMPILTSTAALTLVFQMFIVIRASFQGREIKDKDHTVRLWVMLSAPYIAYLITIIATALTGFSNPDSVSRSRRYFYCSVKADGLTNALALIAALNLFVTLVLEVWSIVLIYQRWAAFRSEDLQRDNIGRLRSSFDFQMPLRIMAFGFYIAIAMSLSILSVVTPASPVPDLLIATAASVFLMIFGTQRDILRALCFWRHPAQGDQPSDKMQNEYKNGRGAC